MSSGTVKAGGVFVEIGADPTKFFAALKSVNKNIASIGKSMQSAGTKMAALGAGVVGPIFASAAAFANVGSALNDMSARTGVAAESLSVLQFAAEQTGTDMGGVETALKKMQKAIFAAGSGSKEASKALAMVGLSASDLAGLSADQQMGKIADGLLAIKDPGSRAAVAMQIFGKAGTDILPMLEGGAASMAAFAAEAKRLGLVMDSETAAKADALGDAMDAMSAAMKMAFIQVGGAVAPILTNLASVLSVVAANVGKFISENQQFVTSALKAGATLVVLGGAVYGVGASLRGLSTGISLVLKGFGLFSALASPVLLVAAGIGAAVFALYKFKDEISAALGPVASLVQRAAGAIGETFGPAVSDGIVVLGDLAATAGATFDGVYEAIVNGNLTGAMDVLWAGLVAGWLRGTEALMSYVDPWVAAFQDVFTDVGAGIYIAWDKIYTDSSAILNTMGAFIMGFFDNIANSVMATFDNLVAGIQIAWTRVQGFITGAEDTEQRVQNIRDANAARAEQRMQERPGIESRTAAAATQNAQAETQRQGRVGAIMSGAEADKAARQGENARRASDRRAGVIAAENRLNDLTTAKQSERDAAKKAAEEIAATTGASAASPGEKAATAGAGAAGAESAVSMGSVAGTFSSLNLGIVFGGSSLAERTAKAAEETAKNTRKIDDGGKVAA